MFRVRKNHDGEYLASNHLVECPKKFFFARLDEKELISGHSKAGRAIEMPNGDTLTLNDRIEHHTVAALSTVEISSKNASRLVDNFKKYYSDSKNNPPGDYKTFIVKSSNPTHKIKALTEEHLLHLLSEWW